MDLHASSAKITGNPDTSGWAQIHEFNNEKEESDTEKLYVVVSVVNADDTVNKTEVGRDLALKLKKYYFSSSPGVEALKKALEEFMTDPFLEKISLVALGIEKDSLSCVVLGNAKLVILRDGRLANLVLGTQDRLKHVTGQVMAGDCFVAASGSFFEFYSDGVIKAALNQETPHLAAEILAPSLHTGGLNGTVGALLLKFNTPKSESVTLPLPRYQTKDVPYYTEPKISLRAKFGGLKKLSTLLPTTSVFIRKTPAELGETNRRKNLSAVMGIVLLIMLITSSYFGMRQKSKKEALQSFNSRLEQAEHYITESVNLASLDPQRSRELFNQGKTLIAEAESENTKDPRVDQLKRLVYENEGKVLGVYRSDEKLFIDLTLLSDGFKGNSLRVYKNKLYVFDKQEKKIISVSMDTKRAEVVAGPGLVKESMGIFAYSDKIFTYNPSGIDQISQGVDRIIDFEGNEELLAYSYAGNIYVLKKTSSQIVKFAPSQGKYVGPLSWLAAGINVDLTTSVNMVIDGSVWVLTQNEIVKFNQGVKQRFTLNMNGSVEYKLDDIFTSENEKYLYVLDKQGSRVLVFEKNGEFVSSYGLDEASDVKGIAVSEENQKLLILRNGKLNFVEIKHSSD